MSTLGIIVTAVVVVVTYLVCGIPFGLVVAKFGAHVDVRELGSGNIGTTNVAREVGKGAAALTLLLDAGKGLVCVLVGTRVIDLVALPGQALSPEGDLAWVGGLVMLAGLAGHIFSPYLHFHGGKGIAVGLGVCLGFIWPVGITILGIFIVLAVVSKRVSLGSVAAAVGLPVFTFVYYGANLPLVVLMAVGAALVIWAHRTNIERLAEGKESAFAFKEDADKRSGTTGADGRGGAA